MLRQYRCSPYRLVRTGGRTVPVGTVPIGTIRRLPSDTVIIEAWLPRECHAACRDPRSGAWQSRYVASGMFLAQVRSLRTGRRFLVSDAHLIHRNAA